MSEVNGTVWLTCGPGSRFGARPAFTGGPLPPFGSPKSLSAARLSAFLLACSALLGTGFGYFRNRLLPCMVFDAPPHCCGGRSLLQSGCAPAWSPVGACALAHTRSGTSCCLVFQRSPLRRSRIAESTPGRRIAASPFAGRLLRLPVVPTPWFHTTSPAFSSTILSALLQRLTTLGFTIVSLDAHGASGSRLPLRGPSRSPWCLSALRSFPSADDRLASCRNSHCYHCVSPHLRGEDLSSCPAVTPLCCWRARPNLRCRRSARRSQP